MIPGWILVLAGISQPLEWAEFPLVVDLFVMIALVGLSAPKYGQLIARVRPGQAMKVGRTLTTGLGQLQAQ